MLKDEVVLKILRAVIVHSPALIAPLPVNRFPNKLAHEVPNNILRNPSFCSFASLLIVSLTSFINKPDYSRDLTIFMISLISSFGINNVVVREAKSQGRETYITYVED